MQSETIKILCDLSKRCGEEWRQGNIEDAQEIGKRYYINMLKMSLAMEKKADEM